MKKILLITAVLAAGLVRADEQRALLTHENRYPGYHRAEVEGRFQSADYGMHDDRELGVGARFGLLTNLTLNAYLPGVSHDNQMGDTSTGLGDAQLGLDLVAYQDLFGFPFLIPHVAASLPTGDEKDGLGLGRNSYTAGITLGTITHDCLTWLVDVSFISEGYGSEENPYDAVRFAGSLVWDLDEKCAVLLEAGMTDIDAGDDYFESVDDPSLVQAGITYDFTSRFTLGCYAGSGSGGDSNLDKSFTVRGIYSF